MIRNVSGGSAEVHRAHPVGHLQHVVHVVADENDADSTVGESSHEFEHLLGLGHAQRSGGLVEDHQPRVTEHRLGNGHGLSLSTGQRRHRLTNALDRPDRQRRQRLACRHLHRVFVEHTSADDLTPEEHVLHDVEVVAERKILVHDLDAEIECIPGIPDRDVFAIETKRSRVDPVDAGDALDECGLARAVVADQCRDGARVDLEVDIVQHVHGPEALVDAGCLQQRCWRRCDRA